MLSTSHPNKTTIENFSLLLVLVFSFAWSSAEAHATEAQARFPLVYGAMSGNTVPLWIAKEQGFFGKYGLDPQLIFIIAGRAAQAMLSGEINIGIIGATHVTNAVTSGADMTQAIVEGVAFARNPANKKIVLQSLARNLRLHKPDLLEKSYQRVDGLPRKPCPSLPGIASVLKLLVQHGVNPKAAQLKTEDIADMSLCKKFAESGFMDRLYQRP